MGTARRTSVRDAQTAFAASISSTAGSAPVLVIDDEGPGPTTLSWLAAAGYETAAAINGDTALRFVRAELVRLVVSELYVPCWHR